MKRLAIVMDPPMGSQMFTPDDPRRGEYLPGVNYFVDDLGQEKADALLAGGGYTLIEVEVDGEEAVPEQPADAADEGDAS